MVAMGGISTGAGCAEEWMDGLADPDLIGRAATALWRLARVQYRGYVLLCIAV